MVMVRRLSGVAGVAHGQRRGWQVEIVARSQVVMVMAMVMVAGEVGRLPVVRWLLRLVMAVVVAGRSVQ